MTKYHVVERRELDGEPAYPIYSVRTKFSELIPADEVSSPFYVARRLTDRPERFSNSTEGGMMFAEALTPEQVTDEIKNAQSRLLKSSPTAEDMETEVTIRVWETWCLAWFNHWTWPKDRTDAELERSFQKYVGRHSRYQNTLSDALLSGYGEEVNRGEYLLCLMGAEEQWRWRGENGDTVRVVCRCAGCSKHGVVRINH